MSLVGVPLPECPIRIASDAHGFSVVVKPSEYVKRGLTIVFLVPLLFALLVFFVFGMTDPELADDATFVWIWLGLSALGALGGMTMALGAGLWSRRSSVRFDRARASLKKYGGAEEALQQFAAVRAHRPSGFGNFCVLEFTRHGGRKPLKVYHAIRVPKYANAVARHAEWLGAALALPVEVDTRLSDADPLGLSENTAALLCYLPIQGIFLIASIYYATRGDRRPLVHFSARQSLCQFAFALVVLMPLLILFGVPVALLEDGPPRVAAIVLLVVALSAFWLWNLAAHVIACYRSYRGVLWVMPWLRPFVSRWIPR